jgi:light-regulated signal transduction histidine kinase (bacteriophytochrome)
VERHQGKIDVETDMGKGSTFIITLPVLVGEGAGADEAKANVYGVKNIN